MIIFIWIIVILFILYVLFNKSSPDSSTIEKIAEGNFQAILTLAENKGIIKSRLNLDIEEGGYYPRFHSPKNIQVAKMAIRRFIENNPKEKYDANFILSQHQLNLIFQSCKSEFIR